MKEIVIGTNEAGQRLDKFLGKYLSEAGKGFIYKMLRKKNITLNGKKAEGGEVLADGDMVRLFLSDETLEKFAGKKESVRTSVKLDIIYEDQDVILINKPAGMLSQKAKPEDISLCEHLVSYLLEKGVIDEEGLRAFRPGVCNRLDRNTSGLIAAGKSLKGLQILSEMLRERQVDKYYLAIVQGNIQKKSGHSAWLMKDEDTNQVRILNTSAAGAERIETEYAPIAYSNGHTLIRVKLITGKTHQIRAHLAALGYPLVGDSKYGAEQAKRFRKNIDGEFKTISVKRQMLHSYELIFPKSMDHLTVLAGKRFSAPLPADFIKCLNQLGFKA